MKRTIIIVLAFFILLLTATGCGKTYERPWDQFCFELDGGLDVKKEIALSSEDIDYILDILNNGKWINSLSNCGYDFVFYTAKQEVGYQSSCGTFNDWTNQRSMTVTEEQYKIINELLNIRDLSITQEKAEEIAIKRCNVNYDYIETTYVDSDCSWKVEFWQSGAKIATQTVTIDSKGNVLSVHYAE